MTERHTQGPWEVRTRNDRSRGIVGAYHFPRGQHPSTGGNLHVCDLSGDTHHDDANAALICAAPELLEALAAFVRWADLERREDVPLPLSAARAAIAKATA